MLQYKDLEDIITSCIPLWLFYFPDSLISLDFFFKKDFPDTVVLNRFLAWQQLSQNSILIRMRLNNSDVASNFPDGCQQHIVAVTKASFYRDMFHNIYNFIFFVWLFDLFYVHGLFQQQNLDIYYLDIMV